jgi:hypothetical protein
LDTGSRLREPVEEHNNSKLGKSIPNVLQQNILGNLLNAVRIRRDNKDDVLYTTKLELKI